ncbi:hypothetical protein IF2G_03817 [Cordyceps javanica]|nr:hypothetical protein IF2G_03817 [Cordyceps javanica]
MIIPLSRISYGLGSTQLAVTWSFRGSYVCWLPRSSHHAQMATLSWKAETVLLPTVWLLRNGWLHSLARNGI